MNNTFASLEQKGLKKLNLSFRIFLLIIFCGSINLKVCAQKYIGLNVDNDLYFGIDRYYSSGIFIEYGFINKDSTELLNNWKYLSRHFTIGQQINTPSRRLTSDISKMDYPYNGWLFFEYQEEKFKDLNFGFGWSIKFGTTGAEASLSKFLQNTYHRLILNLEPLTWAESIPQAFHVNFKTSIYWGKILANNLKYVNVSNVQVGTFRTSAKTRLGFQFGSLPGLPFFGNRLEQIQKGISLFFGVELEHNIHDYSLSGGFISNNNPFQFEVKQLRNKYQLGFIYIRIPWKFHLLFNNSSPFVLNQRYRRHPYLNISLGYIFDKK